MNLQAEKLDLIKWIADINEPAILKKFISLKKRQETDWWDNISNEEKAEINEGLAQAENGETYSHEEAMASYQKWLSK